MDQTNTNQHYISEVLLKRFRNESGRLQCYQLKTGQWRQRSTRDTCAAKGYNQLLVDGKADHSVENEFSKIETRLPLTFAFLEEVANGHSTTIPADIHANLRDYCSYLKLISPVAKPGAVVAMMFEINMGLEKENYYLLRELGVTEEAIQQLRAYYVQGGRVVIEAKNLMQQLYRFQFSRLLPSTRQIFDTTNWFVCNSPIDIPISDVGLVPVHLQTQNANHFILPIGRRLVLEGIFYFDAQKNTANNSLKRMDYQAQEAEYRLDCICASAIREIICSRRIENIPQCIKRARENKIVFHKIANPGQAEESGQHVSDPNFGLRVVNIHEYKQFVHTYLLPTDDPN